LAAEWEILSAEWSVEMMDFAQVALMEKLLDEI
jgi:hypothetical protein